MKKKKKDLLNELIELEDDPSLEEFKNQMAAITAMRLIRTHNLQGNLLVAYNETQEKLTEEERFKFPSRLDPNLEPNVMIIDVVVPHVEAKKLMLENYQRNTDWSSMDESGFEYKWKQGSAYDGRLGGLYFKLYII